MRQVHTGHLDARPPPLAPGRSRLATGRPDHHIRRNRRYGLHVHKRIKPNFDTETLDLMHEIIYDDANICTMGGATRIIDCPAQLLVCLTKDHAVTAPGRRVGCFEPGRPATYYKDASRGRRSRGLLDDFGANRRIDPAGD